MTDDDIEKLEKVVTACYTYYEKPVSDFTLDIFTQALKPYEIDAVIRAFGVYSATGETGQFAPRPPDIVKLIEGSAEDRAMRAWSVVTRAMSSVGRYETVVFDDPLIHAVISQMGGWIDLCGTDIERELPFRKQEFVKRYRAYVTQRIVPSYPGRLVGITEQTNRSNGYREIAGMILIGDQEKARTVFLNGQSASGMLTVGKLLQSEQNQKTPRIAVSEK